MKWMSAEQKMLKELLEMREEIFKIDYSDEGTKKTLKEKREELEYRSKDLEERLMKKLEREELLKIDND